MNEEGFITPDRDYKNRNSGGAPAATPVRRSSMIDNAPAISLLDVQDAEIMQLKADNVRLKLEIEALKERLEEKKLTIEV